MAHRPPVIPRGCHVNRCRQTMIWHHALKDDWGPVIGIASHTLARKVVKTVELRSIPPRRVGVGHGLGSTRQVGTISLLEGAGGRVLRDVSLVDAVVGP